MNFDLKKFLIENKITGNSKVLSESDEMTSRPQGPVFDPEDYIGYHELRKGMRVRNNSNVPMTIVQVAGVNKELYVVPEDSPEDYPRLSIYDEDVIAHQSDQPESEEAALEEGYLRYIS